MVSWARLWKTLSLGNASLKLSGARFNLYYCYYYFSSYDIAALKFAYNFPETEFVFLLLFFFFLLLTAGIGHNYFRHCTIYCRSTRASRSRFYLCGVKLSHVEALTSLPSHLLSIVDRKKLWSLLTELIWLPICSTLYNRELKHRRFWAMDVNRKFMFFL